MIESFFAPLVVLFEAQPVGFSLLAVAFVCIRMDRYLRRKRMMKMAHVHVDQDMINQCLEKWKKFRPDMMPQIYRDLTYIRQKEEVVCIGHLEWLAKKLTGEVLVETAPPRIRTGQQSLTKE